MPTIDETLVSSNTYHQEMVDLINTNTLETISFLRDNVINNPVIYPELTKYKSAVRFQFIIEQLIGWGILEQVGNTYKVAP